MCFVCGRANPVGLHLRFLRDEQNRVQADFTPLPEHQGFPGVMHGGLISAVLDETIGRTAIALDLWCVTGELTVRYHQPVAIGEPVRITGKVVETRARVLRGHGEIRRQLDNLLLAEAEGIYIRIPEERRRLIENDEKLDWRVDA